MSRPHRSIWVVRVVAALATTCLLVACSREPKPKPKSNAELSQLLLTDATAPDGVYVPHGPMDDFGSSASWTVPRSLTCDDLYGTVYMLREDPARQIYGEAHTMLLRGVGAQAWVGLEWLVSYRPGGARRALSNIRSVASKCPYGVGFPFSLKPGPKAGDDSLAFVNGDEVRNEIVLVRIGDCLLAVESQFVVSPSTTSLFGDLVESAVDVYDKG
jgi:hypothetical protein